MDITRTEGKGEVRLSNRFKMGGKISDSYGLVAIEAKMFRHTSKEHHESGKDRKDTHNNGNKNEEKVNKEAINYVFAIGTSLRKCDIVRVYRVRKHFFTGIFDLHSHNLHSKYNALVRNSWKIYFCNVCAWFH